MFTLRLAKKIGDKGYESGEAGDGVGDGAFQDASAVGGVEPSLTAG